MEYKLQTLHFNATEKLVAYIEKKLAKLDKNPDLLNIELTLKVVKPESANNKVVTLHATTPGREVHVEKVSDTFEESFDLCLDVLRRDLEKIKENRA